MTLFQKLIFLTYTILLPCVSFADFKNADFVGEYISYSVSAGNNTTPDPKSVAITTVAQFNLNKDETGTVNFLNVMNFFSTTSQFAQNFTNLPIQYKIDNRCIGVGTLTISNYPIPGVNLNTTFVATKALQRSKGRRALVNKLFVNANSSSSAERPIGDASVIIAQRQFN